jgi:hypothetical protein
MATPEEIEGRLAALELATAKALHFAGNHQFGSTWYGRVDNEADNAIREIQTVLSGQSATAAEASLRLIFDRSRFWNPPSS